MTRQKLTRLDWPTMNRHGTLCREQDQGVFGVYERYTTDRAHTRDESDEAFKQELLQRLDNLEQAIRILSGRTMDQDQNEPIEGAKQVASSVLCGAKAVMGEDNSPGPPDETSPGLHRNNPQSSPPRTTATPKPASQPQSTKPGMSSSPRSTFDLQSIRQQRVVRTNNTIAAINATNKAKYGVR